MIVYDLNVTYLIVGCDHITHIGDITFCSNTNDEIDIWTITYVLESIALLLYNEQVKHGKSISS